MPSLDIASATNLLNSLIANPRDLTSAESEAIIDLGQEIGERITSRADATPDETNILDACQGIRMNDGPSVGQIFICVPGDDIPSTEFLNRPRVTAVP